MKFVFFAMLLIIAGASCAKPEPVEVEPAQGRIIDLIIRDAIATIIRWLRNTGMDPLDIVERNFDYNFPGLFNLQGVIENFRFTGLSNILIHDLYYNILFGRLAFDFSLPELKATLKNAEAKGRFFTRDIDGQASGSLSIKDIRLKGNALLILTTNWVEVYNINVDFTVYSIESDLTVVGSEDYSETVNEFLNVRVPSLLVSFRNEINVLLGEGIRRAVHWWNTQRPW